MYLVETAFECRVTASKVSSNAFWARRNQASPTETWGGVRDRARAVLAFDPENVNAIVFESAALMALDPPVIGKSAEKGPASVPSQPQPMFLND